MIASEKSHKVLSKKALFKARRHKMQAQWNTFKRTYWGRNIICISLSVISWGIMLITFTHQAHPTSDLTPLWKSLAYAPVAILLGYIIQRIIKGASDVMRHTKKRNFEKEALGLDS
jgi:uncharacterized membrane protein YcjF (UPF0283 family)